MKRVLISLAALGFVATTAFAQPQQNMQQDHQMSSMVNKMKEMKAQRLGSRMMMLGIKLKMYGDYLAKTGNADEQTKASKLMQLGDELYNTGHEMAPQGMVNSWGSKGRCRQMMMSPPQPNQ